MHKVSNDFDLCHLEVEEFSRRGVNIVVLLVMIRSRGMTLGDLASASRCMDTGRTTSKVVPMRNKDDRDFYSSGELTGLATVSARL
jgi:hypothetical protein